MKMAMVKWRLSVRAIRFINDGYIKMSQEDLHAQIKEILLSHQIDNWKTKILELNAEIALKNEEIA